MLGQHQEPGEELEYQLASINGFTYMNWPVTFLHVVGSQKVSYTCKLVKKTIFKAKHRCWANNCGFWEDITDYLLCASLGGI